VKVSFLEKIIKNKKIVKLNYFTLNLDEHEPLQIYDLNYYSQRLRKYKEELDKKLNNLLKKEEYNLTENLKNYAIFNNLIEEYVEILETEFTMNLEIYSKNSSLIINGNTFYLSLSPEDLFKIIEDSIKQKKDLLVEIINDLDKNKVSYDVITLEKNKKKKS
jgi:hypothetical protein